MRENEAAEYDGETKDMEKFLEGKTTLVEEELDKTEVLVALIDALTHKQDINSLGERIEELNESRIKALERTFVPNVGEKAFDIYEGALEIYSREEEGNVIEKRKSQLFGFGKERDEKNSELAYEQATRLLDRVEELENRRQEIIQELREEQKELTNDLKEFLVQDGDEQELLRSLKGILEEMD